MAHDRAKFEHLLYKPLRIYLLKSYRLAVGVSNINPNQPMQSNFTCQEIHFTPSQLRRIKAETQSKYYICTVHTYIFINDTCILYTLL